MKVGTGSGRRQSAILVPVPDAEEVVAPYRIRYDPVAAAGVPAHITLVVPWVAPDDISLTRLDQLAEVVAAVDPFEFRLIAVRWFGRAVLWLAPDPVGPFVKLTMTLAERFGTPPYDGVFDEIVPHLTVAHSIDGTDLDPVAEQLAGQLPVACLARHVWVMVGDGETWAIRATCRLG